MDIEEFKNKNTVVVVYTGEGKGKTSAALGMMSRALGARWRVAFIQFIKYWGVSEHVFIRDINQIFKDQLFFYKGGKGFYNAKGMSAKSISKSQHLKAAQDTYDRAYECSTSGNFQLVILDEINNAVHDGLLTKAQLKKIIINRSPKTSLCLTGRNFPDDLVGLVDIATNMTKIKHHFDDKFIANKGIDY